jgi:hypothetical protein
MKKCTKLSIFKNFDSSKIETFNTTLMLVIESMNSALPDNGHYTAKSNNAKLWLIYHRRLHNFI